MESKTKKQLKDEYKQMKFKAGVFAIRNIVNDKIFVSSSVNLDAIWNRHRLQLNFGAHPVSELLSDWKLLGEDKFRFEILSEIKQNDEMTDKDIADEVKSLEKLYLEELQPYGDKGYNKPEKI